MTPRLTALQRELLEAFFARSQALFLTGGAVLAGYDFGHRMTDDLDLFGFVDADLEEQERVLQDVCATSGVALSSVSRHVDFRRWLATRGDERCVIDLVRDRAPPIETVKRTVGRVVLDTRREIAANKVAALVGRSEIRDLIDLQRLLESGEPLERFRVDLVTRLRALALTTAAR